MLPLLMLISIPIAYYVKGYGLEQSIKIGPAVNLLAFVVLGCLPTLIIHITHHQASKNLHLQIDEKAGTLTVNQKATYSLDSLHCTEYLSFYKKKEEDGKFRPLTPWSNYSYLLIRLPEKKTLRVSSLIAKGEYLSLKINKRKYTYWPAM